MLLKSLVGQTVGATHFPEYRCNGGAASLQLHFCVRVSRIFDPIQSATVPVEKLVMLTSRRCFQGDDPFSEMIGRVAEFFGTHPAAFSPTPLLSRTDCPVCCV